MNKRNTSYGIERYPQHRAGTLVYVYSTDGGKGMAKLFRVNVSFIPIFFPHEPGYIDLCFACYILAFPNLAIAAIPLNDVENTNTVNEHIFIK